MKNLWRFFQKKISKGIQAEIDLEIPGRISGRNLGTLQDRVPGVIYEGIFGEILKAIKRSFFLILARIHGGFPNNFSQEELLEKFWKKKSVKSRW